ncbi:hypothetical protein N658DRAFT_23901 [Parathielavia hyrcaniae]|uniref:Uncharacterized protein n=1 Tax=Parathielavia hyrcaniae TaxID=113614 RepID=A0AAN6QAG0_9PEZI|nr:hypothetical protein N658DRAFT_23901 [Parathielavia hyrcaniae]
MNEPTPEEQCCSASFHQPSLGPRRLISTASGQDWLSVAASQRTGKQHRRASDQPSKCFLLSRDRLLGMLGIRWCFQTSAPKVPGILSHVARLCEYNLASLVRIRRAAVLDPRYHLTIILSFPGGLIRRPRPCVQQSHAGKSLVAAPSMVVADGRGTLLDQQTHMMAHGGGQLGPRPLVMVCVCVMCGMRNMCGT